jgi:hypothetical protein
MSELSKQCLLIEKCKKVSQINCTDRDYINCDFFKNLIGVNCDRIVGNCKKCRFTIYCNRPNNETKPKVKFPKPQVQTQINHDYKEEFRMPER